MDIYCFRFVHDFLQRTKSVRPMLKLGISSTHSHLSSFLHIFIISFIFPRYLCLLDFRSSVFPFFFFLLFFCIAFFFLKHSFSAGDFRAFDRFRLLCKFKASSEKIYNKSPEPALKPEPL